METVGDSFLTLSKLGEFSFEKEFRSADIIAWSAQNFQVPVIATALYLLMCYVGPKIMEKRAAFDLVYPLALWNAFLCVFSFIGMCRTVPFALYMLFTKPSFHEAICGDQAFYSNSTCGLWVMLFIYSKLPELVDTVFIVLRKKPLIFLHWYHHATVLLYCWHAFATGAGSGIYFVAMNYTVHAIMYGYYCLQALKMVPKNFPAHLITLAQITQMVLGTGICAASCYYVLSGTGCRIQPDNMIAAVLMYGSYLYLFCEFAVKRYIFKSAKKPVGAKKLD